MLQTPVAAARSEQLSKRFDGLDAGSPPASAATDSALLDGIGCLEDARVLLIGAGMIGIMCAAIRRGCAEVSLLSAGDRVEANSADLAVVSAAASRKLADAPWPGAGRPDTGRPDTGHSDIGHSDVGPCDARHPVCLCARVVYALAPLGSLAVVLDPADAAGGLADRIGRTLHRHGLSAIRTKALPDGRALLLAERPLIGRLA